MASRQLSEQERAAINKRAMLVDKNFEQTYRSAYRTEYGKDPDAVTVAEACSIYHGTHKSATARKDEDKIMDKSLNGLPVGWKVEKQADSSVKVFMPTLDGWQEVDQDAFDALMLRLAGKGTSESREPMYSPQRFTSGDALGRDVTDAPRPPQTYGFDEPGLPGARVGPNFVSAPIDPGIAEPMDFDAPEPGRNPADGPAPVDLAEDRVSVFKARGKVTPGLFSAFTIPRGQNPQ